ncbi:unnamed protein product, partial [Polarella glacialis]
ALVARGVGRGRARSWRVAASAATAVVEAPATEVSPAKVKALKDLFTDLLDVKVPKKLEVFLSVLQASDFSILGRDEWKTIGGDLHPFIIPVATIGALDDDLQVVGLMIREPNGATLRPDAYQVVSQRPRKSKYVEFISKDVDKYIMRRAEEATFRKEKEDLPIVEATSDVYDVRFTGKDRTALDKWLLLE